MSTGTPFAVEAGIASTDGRTTDWITEAYFATPAEVAEYVVADGDGSYQVIMAITDIITPTGGGSVPVKSYVC